MTELSGSCLCGQVKWSSNGPVTRSLVCHCTDCQRATSSPFTAFVGLKPETVEWSGTINHYESSPETWRGFCPACGSRMYFKSGQWPGEVHVHAATLDEGCDYRPSAQVVLQSRAGWLGELETIPQHQSFQASPAGRSGKG
ncbi:MAG: GFA family protein [Rhodobacteraceae bacterium]|nr:GFA family protein [Paracoccaceae bacterium]